MALLGWTPKGWEDYLYRQGQDKKTCRRIDTLINTALRTPFAGEGKPETLRYQLPGLWSRRIDQEHRLIYAWYEDMQTLTILQCRYHYERG